MPLLRRRLQECRWQFALWLFVASVLAACAERAPPPRSIGQLDLARYAGRWFEIARLPTRFQDGPGLRCEAVTADYRLLDEGGIEVINRCRNAAAAEAMREARGFAYSSAPGNDRLRVTFFWPFFGDYWVIGLDPAYRWAVVGSPDRRYLWILAREPALAPADYAAAVAIAAGEGFAVERLQRTVQP